MCWSAEHPLWNSQTFSNSSEDRPSQIVIAYCDYKIQFIFGKTIRGHDVFREYAGVAQT
jgi:hypothetical protein